MILTTNVYEKSFRDFLSNRDNDFFRLDSRLFKKIITVNNIDSRSLDEFGQVVNEVKAKYPDISFVFSSEYKDLCNETFRVNLSESNVSYLYSIHNYTSLYLGIETGLDFVLTIGADCKLSSLDIEEFVAKSIDEIKKDPSLLSTTLPWGTNKEEIGNHEESCYPPDHFSDSFYLSKVMSDQVFFCSARKILDVVNFNINEVIHPYPKYVHGGFENRLCNFMIKNNYYRGIYKGDIYYSHKSY
jgi:hypothetical protein